MTASRFPSIALGLGLVLAFILLASGAHDPAGEHLLPLLMLLLMSELGFIVTAAGAFVAIRVGHKTGISFALVSTALGCVAMAIGFVVIGLALWPATQTT
jgi:hypothetical protein